MRLLRRHPDRDEVAERQSGGDPAPDEEAPAGERGGGAPEPPRGERQGVVPDVDRVPPERPGPDAAPPDHGGPVVPDARAGDTGDEARPISADQPDLAPERAEPVETERIKTDEVVVARWSWADGVVALAGAALALIGAVALVRTGVNSTWFRPEVEVLGASHTALLGALEVGAGALLVLSAVARSRVLITLLGLAVAVAGAVAAIETAEFSRELAIETWWGWTLAGAGVVVALLALVPRRGRVERIVRTG